MTDVYGGGVLVKCSKCRNKYGRSNRTTVNYEWKIIMQSMKGDDARSGTGNNQRECELDIGYAVCGGCVEHGMRE